MAVLVLLLFLPEFQSSCIVVVLLIIPISLLSTFTLLYFCGYTLNTIPPLSGLALATGLIVDDAVVVLENIFRHIEERDKRRAVARLPGAVARNLLGRCRFHPDDHHRVQHANAHPRAGWANAFFTFSPRRHLLNRVQQYSTPRRSCRCSRLGSSAKLKSKRRPIQKLVAQRGKKVGPIGRVFNWSRPVGLMPWTRRTTADSYWSLKHRWWLFGGGIAVTGAY